MIGDRASTPWHLWVIGIASLLWHAVGANDYVMTQTRNMDYLRMSAENANVPLDVMLDYFTTFPAWADAAWAFGVWGALAGSILLLLRSRFATFAFYASLAGLFVSTIHQIVGDVPPELSSPFFWAFTGFIIVVTVALAVYCRRMTARGVLR
ncbi:hypothetical protein [Aurantiacibacter gangjinensis]|uniref:Uncharacterized protein n=1 Tax=Aurantiacibacter gangjinensis TaxID=502682 RepID=A0A0G9MRQ1_9SPHN|nr:hypothetical protein [Aurantiacibacter gangjinensis]APE26971.1 hypothetical protein BMF35_a0142 [Aurantiacibacter gangjinensis]KLE33421.1 hypothetical protein AAW01_05705 [Aurantiacibacter gangjinensis]